MGPRRPVTLACAPEPRASAVQIGGPGFERVWYGWSFRVGVWARSVWCHVHHVLLLPASQRMDASNG